MMKKLFIAFIALGALSFAPSAEAARNRKTEKECKTCPKKEKTCKDCVVTKRVEQVGTRTKPTMVPGLITVTDFEEVMRLYEN